MVAADLPIVLTYPRFFGVRLNASNSFSTPSIEQQSIGERMLLVQSAGSMIADHPVFGVGLGAAPLALKAYRPDWPVGYEPPHVAWLEAAVETGLPGAVFYLVLMVAPLFAYCAWGGLAVADPPAAAIIVLLLAISVVGLFDYYTWLLVPGRLWQWLAFGLWAAASIPSSPLVSDLSKSQPNKISSTIHVSPTA